MVKRISNLIVVSIFVAIITVLFLAGSMNKVTSLNNTNHVRVSSNSGWKINVTDLVIDSISSVYRMFAALAISFLVALIVGIIAARKPLGSKILIPIIDILQSVP